MSLLITTGAWQAVLALLLYWLSLFGLYQLALTSVTDSHALAAAIFLACLPVALLTAQVCRRQRRQHAKNQIERDALTGLGTRRAFIQHTRQLLARGLPGSFALLLVDVDGLKATNHECGHEAGDELLSVLALRLSSSGAAVFRVGGDEFALLIDRTQGESVTSMLRNLEPFLARFETCGHEHRISSSYGYASCRENEGLEDFFARAETLLRGFKQRLYALDDAPERKRGLGGVTSLQAARQARDDAMLTLPS